jgi:hypothetical protein
VGAIVRVDGVPERDQSRHLAVGAGASPADPDDTEGSADDVVQAVADFVDDLVDGADPPPIESSSP